SGSPREALVVLLALLRSQKPCMPTIAKRPEHPPDRPVSLLLGVDVLLVHIIVPDHIERLRIERHALAILPIQRRRTLRAPNPETPEPNRKQHHDGDGHPRHRIPQLTSTLGTLPHATIVSQHASAFGLRSSARSASPRLSARSGPSGLHFQHATPFGLRFQEVVSGRCRERKPLLPRATIRRVLRSEA